jgi:maleate isomerase
MPDHLGYRKIFGVTGPSTNTIVQPDFDDLRPIGVTNHYSRIIIPNMPVNNNEDFLRLVKAIMGETLAAKKKHQSINPHCLMFTILQVSVLVTL